jgi:hypothetical protein
MPLKEIDLNLENRPGQLSVVSDLLGSNGINIIAFYASTKGEEVSFRLIVDSPEKAILVLKARGYKMDVGDVIACEVPNHPGGLNSILKPLKKEGINIDYIYPCLSSLESRRSAILIVGVAQKDKEKTVSLFKENWIRVLEEELYRI